VIKYKNIIIGLVIILVAVVADQVTKNITVASIPQNSRAVHTIIEGFIYISHVRNLGAAWGILQGNTFILVGMTSVVLVACFVFMFFTRKMLLTVPVAMIVGGGLGNLTDRIFRTDGVVDFIDVYIFGYDFPIFNVADSILVCGTIMLIVYILFIYKEDDPGWKFKWKT